MQNAPRFPFAHHHSRIRKNGAALAAAVASLFVLFAAGVSAQAPAKPLEQTFPETVGTFARSAVKKATASAPDATDSAEATYTAPSGEITWTAAAFATPEKAHAALDSAITGLTKAGGKVASSINNAEGKVRFAVLETPQGPTYCWVNKKEKTVMYTVTGKAPDVSKFVELQKTW
jgi:hypothetical protein